MSAFTDAQKRIGELDREVSHWVESQGDTQAKADRLQAELDEMRSQLARSRANTQEVNWLCNEAKNDLWLTSEKLRLREEEVEVLKAQLATVTSTITSTITEVSSQPVEKPDLEALTEKALASLKLGKQAPGYKAAVKAIAKFREFLEGG